MVAPPPDPNPLLVSLEVLGWEMRTVCVGGGGGGDRGQPSPNGNLYRNTEEMGIIHECLISPTAFSFIPHILLRRLSSFSAFSYSAQLQYAPSPMMLTSSFIKRLLLPHLSSFRAFSYDSPRVRHGSVGSMSARCKAGPSSNPDSAPQGGVCH